MLQGSLFDRIRNRANQAIQSVQQGVSNFGQTLNQNVQSAFSPQNLNTLKPQPKQVQPQTRQQVYNQQPLAPLLQPQVPQYRTPQDHGANIQQGLGDFNQMISSQLDPVEGQPVSNSFSRVQQSGVLNPLNSLKGFSQALAPADYGQQTKELFKPIIGEQRAGQLGYGLQGATQLTPAYGINMLDQKYRQVRQQAAPQTQSDKDAQQIGRATYGLALTAPLGGPNLVRNVLGRAVTGTAFGAGLGAGISKVTGGDWKQGAKQGALSGYSFAPLGAITNPLTSKVLSKVPTLLQNQLGQRGIGGIANVIEDELQGFIDGYDTDTKSRITSLVIGAALTGNKELLASIRKQLSNMGIKNPDDLIQKAKSRLPESPMRMQFEANGQKFDRIMSKKDASDWTAYLQSQNIKYQLDDLGSQGGFFAGSSALGFDDPGVPKFSSTLDKKPRFEVDDSGAKLKLLDRSYKYGKPQELKDIIDHRELFENYPDLKYLEVNFGKGGSGSGGSYDPKWKTINLGEKALGENGKLTTQGKSTLLHEIQHAIQEIEGFARGGSPQNVGSSFLKRANQLKEQAAKETSPSQKAKLLKQADEAMDTYRLGNVRPEKAYQRLSGELEARAVQRRMDMPMDQRLKTDPYSAEALATTGTTNPNDYITRFEGGTSMSKPDPTEALKVEGSGLYGTSKEGWDIINSSDGKITSERLYLLNQQAELYPNKKMFIDSMSGSDLTKSQLTDIYNQATAPTKVPINQSRIPRNQAAFDAAADAKNNLPPASRGNRVTQMLSDTYDDAPDALKRTFGPTYDKHIAPVMQRYTKRSGDAVDYVNTYRKQLEALPVKPGSEDDKLIRLFQKKNGEKEVIGRVGRERATELKQTYDQLRNSYDEIIEFVNEQRRSVGLNEIPKKDDFLSQIGADSGKSMLDANIQGGVQTAGPTSSPIFKKQSQEATTGAIESMAQYLEYIKRAGFTDLTAKELLDVRDAMGSMGGVSTEALEQLTKVSKNISGEKEINPLFQTAENIMGKLRAAKVVGKLGTLVSQTLALPQAIIEAGPINFVKGQFSTEAMEAIGRSNFLKSVNDRMPRSLRVGNAYTKAVGIGGDALMEAQNQTNRLTWKGLYERAKSLGIQGDEAIKWADKELPKIVGDRRVGMSPEAYNSAIGKIFGAFTIEPTAAIKKLVTSIGEKKVGTVLGTLTAWHIGNNLNEKYGSGFRPFFDPYESIKDSLEFAQGSDDREQSNVKALTTLFSAALQTNPILNNMFNTGYSVGESVGILPDSRDVMGDDTTWMNTGSLYNPLNKWDRSITGNKAIDVPWNVASNTLPFFEQAARTTQAGRSLDRGYAETKDGSPMYQMPENPLEQGRALLFGQSSTGNAREFFDNDFPGWLSDNQQKAFDRIENKDEKLAFLEDAQGRNKKINQLKAGISTGGAQTGSDTSIGGLLTKPTSSAEASENKAIITELLNAGQIPSDKDMSIGLFSGIKADTEDLGERNGVFNTLKSTLSSEFISDEQRAAILKSAGVTPEVYEYFEQAALPENARTQQVVQSLHGMEQEEWLPFLMQSKMAVGGKALVTTPIITHLYENDYISKAEKKMLDNLLFNEITGEFDFKKSYKGSGGSGGSGKRKAGDLKKGTGYTLSQLQSMVQFDLPTKSLGSGSDDLIAFLSKLSQPNKPQTGTLDDILARRPKRQDFLNG